MTVARSHHPSPLILDLFDEGRLDAGGVAAVLTHLDTCPECHQKVMTRPATSRLRQMRSAQCAASSGTIPAIEERKKPVKPQGRWVWAVMGAGALLALLVLGLWASGAFRPKDHPSVASQSLDTERSPGGPPFVLGNTGRAGDGLLSDERSQEFTYYLDSAPHKGSRRVLTRDLGGGVKMDFVRIAAKGKTFTMGSPKTEDGHSTDEVEHPVTLSADYYLGMTAVTRGQFAAFVKDDGYETEAEKGDGAYGWDSDKKEFRKDKKFNWRNPGFAQTDAHPVVCVSWNDAQAFCKWLKRKDGRDYSLPTEAQWECAGRAGTSTAYSFGNDAKQLGEHAWYSDNSGDSTHPVGTKNPNPWGLYDMHGNVWQWCSDVYGGYPTEAVTDPQGPKEGSARVIRGGSWYDAPRYGGSAIRDGYYPTFRLFSLGFRVAVPVGSL